MRLPRSVLFFVACTTLSAATIYDLKADWSDINNPNGPWAYRQGTTLLPYQPILGPICCGFPFGGWAPSANPHAFLPMIARDVPGAPGDLLPGDVWIHSVDGGNGNPALGEANVTWTAPSDGVIDIALGLWHAQTSYNRSNDFYLTLRTALLNSGTISATNGWTRNNPYTFNTTGLSVHTGDVIQFTLQRTPGQFSGTATGVNLTITLTPEPATCALLLSGLAALAFRVHRSRRTT